MSSVGVNWCSPAYSLSVFHTHLYLEHSTILISSTSLCVQKRILTETEREKDRLILHLWCDKQLYGALWSGLWTCCEEELPKNNKKKCQSLWDSLITINLSISPHSTVLAATFRDRLHHSDGPHPPRQSRTRRKQM